MVRGKIADKDLAVQQRRKLHKRPCIFAGLAARGKRIKLRKHLLKAVEILQNAAVALGRRGGKLPREVVDIHPAARAAPVVQQIAAQDLACRLFRHHGGAGALFRKRSAHRALRAQMRNGQQNVHIIGGIAMPPQPQVQLIEPVYLVRAAEDHAFIHRRHTARALKRRAHALHILGILPFAVIL